LEELKLSDNALEITATYAASGHKSIPARINFTSDSILGTSGSGGQSKATLKGEIINFNTFEDFKNSNAVQRTKERGLQLWESDSYENTFLLFSFADLKSHMFYYWFSFPTINFPPLTV
jgi:ubiquitin-like modifier-activating enzyme ATG7